MNTCWWHRLRLILSSDAPSSLPPSLTRHLEQCDACRARREADLRLATALEHEALARQTPAPSARARRIRRALATTRHTDPHPALSWRTIGGQWAPALSLVLLAAAVLWRFWPGSTSGEKVPDQLAGLRPPELLAAVGDLWPGSDGLIQLSSHLDQPLEAELQAVVSDARSAVQGLASNFLPQKRP